MADMCAQEHPHIAARHGKRESGGHAQDRFVVRDLHASISTPFVSSRYALLTAERSLLEPGAVEHKWYVRGIGAVADRDVRGGHDHQHLVAVRRR